MEPVTQYARSGDVSVAYQVAGDGPVDLVLVPGAFSHLEFAATNPHLVAFGARLASFSRLITLDKRGTGMSDRDVAVYSLEERMDDLRAVMDAAGSERAVLMGTSEGGPMSILFAATYPERTAGLILFGTFPRIIDGDGWRGVDPETWEALIDEAVSRFGEGPPLEVWAPSVAGQPGVQEWWAAYHRAAASPGAVRIHMRMQAEIDVRAVLPTIQCPTLVLHRRGDGVVPFKAGQYLASNISKARLVELPGRDHLPYGEMEELFGAIEEFVTGSRSGPAPTRVLGTIVFTDLVDSTAHAATQGDSKWRQILDRHDEVAQRRARAFGGRVVKQTGDGVLALFDGPARAVRFASEVGRDLAPAGVKIRAGVHTGEVELRGDDVAGIAVHLAARVAALAGPGEVLTSRTVKDLTAGSGLQFLDRGTHTLKGVPDEWQVFAVQA